MAGAFFVGTNARLSDNWAVIWPVLFVLPLLSLAQAADIGPGSKAPPLDIKTWYKGAPIRALAKDKTYVIEFWATWCGPCIQAMPHISKLARANKDVTFIGVAVWQPDKGNVIRDFVRDMGAQMDYHVGYTGEKGQGMGDSWLKSAGVAGIPTTFIVKNGTIQWIGHPMGLDVPLAEVKAGAFDLRASKLTHLRQAASDKAFLESRTERAELSKFIADGKYEEIKPKFQVFYKRHPLAVWLYENIELPAAFAADPGRTDELVQIVIQSKDNRRLQTLIFHATRRVEKGEDIPRMTKFVEQAEQAVGKSDPWLLFMIGLFYEKVKEPERALEMSERAIALFPTSDHRGRKDIEKEFLSLRDRVKKAD